ncbi:MAG: hypothetical protein QXL22_04745 [Candidatus Nezhaarchaeales archaeon]|nr:hypothetical protein [Candidatus Nezhaarchaeota archaeon]
MSDVDLLVAVTAIANGKILVIKDEGFEQVSDMGLRPGARSD